MTVTTVSLLLGFAFITGILYQHFEDEIYDQLKSEASYIGVGIDEFGMEYLDKIDTEQRLTLIEDDGDVIYDNQFEVGQMSNHIDREEVELALKQGFGKSERYSDTVGTKTLYYALTLKNGLVLRIADYQNTVLVLVFRMIQPMLIIFIFTLCLGVYISKKLSEHITEPINAINLDNPDVNIVYRELDPLISRLRRLTKSLKIQVDEAQKQQEEFKMITDHMAEGFVVIGKDLSILSHNDSICQHLDINNDVIGQSVYDLCHDKFFVRFIERTMKGSHEDWVQEIDGRYFQWISNPVRTGDRVGGAVIMMMDITEKAKRDHFRSEFTANISHELKTPLTSISGFAEIIQNGIAREEDVQSFAGDIYKESQRLIHLVNDIIRISQLDDQSLVYQRENIEVAEEVSMIVETLKHAAKKKNVVIHFNDDKMILLTVPSIFQEVVYNLIDNAIKYNKENGMVWVNYSKDENFFTLSVKDTGIGIPIQSQQRIFERFYRVDKSRSSQNGGTGLGLSIVKHGVTTLNGTIDLKSVLHEGTEITITLPLK